MDDTVCFYARLLGAIGFVGVASICEYYNCKRHLQDGGRNYWKGIVRQRGVFGKCFSMFGAGGSEMAERRFFTSCDRDGLEDGV